MWLAWPLVVIPLSCQYLGVREGGPQPPHGSLVCKGGTSALRTAGEKLETSGLLRLSPGFAAFSPRGWPLSPLFWLSWVFAVLCRLL